MVKKSLLLFTFFLICACSSAKKAIPLNSFATNGSTRYESTTNGNARHESVNTPVVRGFLINNAVFEKGGTLFLGSFAPGPGAAANEETDRLSLMLMKGIKETLPHQKTHFTIVADDQSSPDFLLQGYIEDYGHEGHFARLVLRKNDVHLSVDGEIWLRQTGEKIFSFQTSAVINLKRQDPAVVAYQMGVAIAYFIGSYKG